MQLFIMLLYIVNKRGSGWALVENLREFDCCQITCLQRKLSVMCLINNYQLMES